jgi:hypothetical protein
VIALFDHHRFVAITRQQRVSGCGEALGNEREELNNLRVDVVELLMERLPERFYVVNGNPDLDA